MTDVIRDRLSPSPRPLPRSALLIALMGLILIGLCMGLALRFYAQMGVVGALIPGGLALLMLIGGALSLVNYCRGTGAMTGVAEADNVFAQAFMQGAEPALLMREGRMIRANRAYEKLIERSGLEPADGHVPGPERLFFDGTKDTASAIYRLFHFTGDEPAEERLERLSPEGILQTFHIRVSRLGGAELWVLRDSSTDDDQADSLLAHAPIGLVGVSEDGRILASNDGFDRWIGSQDTDTPAYLREVLADPAVLLDSPKTPGRTVRADTRLITLKGLAVPAVMVAVWREVAKDRFVAHVALHGHSNLTAKPTKPRPVAAAEGAAGGESLAVAQDLEAAPIGIVELSGPEMKTARITRMNTAFKAMTGGKNRIGALFAETFKPDHGDLSFLEADARDLAAGEPFDGVTVKEDLSVSTYIVHDRKTGISRAFLVDISARKSLEDQLVQSQKMQAVGRLVAEIAHDFNNILAAIRLYTDTLLGRHPIGDPSYPELQQINANVNRASSLVKKLLAYSRKQTIRAVRLDVSENLSEMAVTLKSVLGERVRLDVVHGRDLPDVKVDKNQFDTVLMNLAVNARDAMKAQGGGNITIESKRVRKQDVSGAALRGALAGIKSDEFVVISVTDTGTGMSDEIKSKIFEPFFTTKPQGEGTGLGLATVYGIVEQSGGHLAVESEPGVGTTFAVWLPAWDGSEDDAEVEVVGAKPKSRPPADLAGQGNILFVEDEDSVRVIAAKTLRKRGYNVVEAADGEEAYELIEEAEVPFDLMISDVVMPGMGGPALLKKARPLLGKARIVFISGYAEEEFSDLLAEEPDVTFLPKPFSLIALAEKVKEEIGESEGV